MSGRDDKDAGIDTVSGLQMVDGAESEPVPTDPVEEQQPDPTAGDDATQAAQAGVAGPSAAGIPLNRDYYPSPTHFRTELRRAPKIHRDLNLVTGQLFADLRVGRPLSVAALRRPLKNAVASILMHPDAMLWMTKIHHGDNYVVDHSVRCAVLAAAFARHLGWVEEKLERLTFGTLLCQIGKTKLPRQLLEKREPLSSEELERVHGYVEISTELARRSDGVFEDVLEIIENHQERYDGSGYPLGRWGDEIPLGARIAGLVHCYDAMTSVRPHTDRVLSNAQNLDFLYEQRDQLFQAQLVEEFIRMLGIYPTGTLVELSNGIIALVVAQNPDNRTQPQVLLVLDREHKPFSRYEKVDIRAYNDHHPERTLTIQRAVNAGEFDIDPMAVMTQHSAGRFSLGGLFGR